MDIHQSLIKDFILPKVKSQYVVDYYEGIQRSLAASGKFPYNDFLAKPRLRTKTEITWATDAFLDKPTLLKDLHGADKDRYSRELKRRIDALRQHIATLEAEGESDLADLLSKTMLYVDEGSVYCGDGSVVVVNWGITPRHEGPGGGSIYRKGMYTGSWKGYGNTPETAPTQPAHMPQDEKPAETEATPPPAEEAVSGDAPQAGQESGQSVTSQPSASEENASDSEAAEPDIDASDNDVQPDATIVTSDEAPQAATAPSAPITEVHMAEQPVIDAAANKPTDTNAHESNATTHAENSKAESKATDRQAKLSDTPSKTAQPATGQYNWHTFFGGFGRGAKFLLRKLWWILALLALLLLIMYLGRNYQGPINRWNPFYCPLPENPTLLPVYQGKVDIGTDGLTQVAADRLNIVLETSDYEAMLEWATAFKKAYPAADYKVYYYDEDLGLLQIEVPAEERKKVKEEIQGKLHNFSFDVFEENVYPSSSAAPDDPELSNQTHSWFLSAIGAFDAWQVTQGSSDVVVAVVDNGFDLTHPELEGKAVKPYNVLTRNSYLRPIRTREGEDAHGTHVAATAVGRSGNGEGLTGVAPGCKLMPVQVGSDHPDGLLGGMAIVEGVLYAIEQGADVVNVSLGMTTPPAIKAMTEGQQLNFISSSYKQEELMWDKVFAKAAKANAIIVFAAGNDNVISGIDPKKRSDATIRVSAVDQSLAKATFSNYGRYANLGRDYSTLSAPGVAIYSAAPHGSYVSLQGTSMAAPIVSGAVALLRSVDADITAAQAIRVLQETGQNVGPDIGPLVNIGRALADRSGAKGSTRCPDVARQIAALQARIDSLKRICPDAAAPTDTLKYDDAIRGDGLNGLWKSTTPLVSSSDLTPIDLYMQFRNLSGQITIRNNGLDYKAPLTVRVAGESITITQTANATSPGTSNSFNRYIYECRPDSKGNLTIRAHNASGEVIFNLVRIG